jgi:sugar/nucleoside kinase (ribokinase family)
VRARLAVCGNVSIDVIDGQAPTVGGGPFHCGQGLRLLERPSLVVTKCAPEDRALCVPALAALGLSLTVCDAATTASFGLHYEGEVRHTEVRAVGDAWTTEDVALPPDVAWVHVAPLVRSDFPPSALAALARGRRISFDGQGLVRAAEVGAVRLDAAYDPAVLRHVSVLKLAEEEAAVILSDTSPTTVASLGVPEVVITLGSRGSVVYVNGDATPVPCHPIGDVDLTGCGDAFGVGYLAARSDGLGPVAAARRATALVALLLTSRRRARR